MKGYARFILIALMAGGLVIMLLTGPAMFSSDPDMYYLNWIFDANASCSSAE